MGLNNLNLSTEPRKYIKRDRPRSIAAIDSKHIVSLNHTSSSAPGLADLSGIISPIEKKVKIQTPVSENKNNNATTTQNGEEWTEISLNNSPDEIYYNNDVYSDEDDQIPYKPLPTDLSPEAAQTIGATIELSRKRLVAQKSLPAMSKVNEVSLSEEKKAEVTRSPSVKSRGKLDGSLANWITRSSVAGETSVGSSSKRIYTFTKNCVYLLNSMDNINVLSFSEFKQKTISRHVVERRYGRTRQGIT